MTAKVHFEVWSGLYCEFFNFIAENEIYISSVRSTDFGFTAVCMAKDYRKVAKAAKKYQCRTKILRKKGLYFKTRKLAAREHCTCFFVHISFHKAYLADRCNCSKQKYYRRCLCAFVSEQLLCRCCFQSGKKPADNSGYIYEC